MSTRRAQLRIGLLALVAPLAAGCGDGSDRDRGPDVRPPAPPAQRAVPVEDSDPGGSGEPCSAPAPVVPAPTDRTGSRARLEAAVRTATRSDRRFVTRLVLRPGTQGPFTARLAGTRQADGSSRATLRWTGAAAIVLPDAEVAIAANRVRIRGTGRDNAWRDVGSASGAALDVGRELLDHPFLLQVVRTSRDGGRIDVVLQARAGELRAYATNERRGPVSDLLRGARSLRITAHLDEGELVGDRFQLVTTVPAGIPALAPFSGRVVRVVGTTGSCPTP